VKIYFDGGNYRNRVCYYDSLTSKKVVKEFNHKEYTNNELEYKALIEAIKYANKQGYERPFFIGDSRLVINQVWYSWKINLKHLNELNKQVLNILPEQAKGKWVRRNHNVAGIHLENLKRKGR